jgi:outer membrane protein OmpA-like peptidoglycan-associated protein
MCGQRTVYIKVVESLKLNPLDSFDVSLYDLAPDFVFIDNAITDSNGLVKFKLNPKGDYFASVNQIRKPLTNFYAKGHLGQFSGDTFIIKVDKAIIYRRRYENIYFEFGSSNLVDFYIAKIMGYLPEFIRMLNENPTWKIEIDGHTDSKEFKDYDIELSRRRVDTLKRCLISNGISESRITTKAMNKTMPMVPNEKTDGQDDPEGRAQNRRVEFHISIKD